MAKSTKAAKGAAKARGAVGSVGHNPYLQRVIEETEAMTAGNHGMTLTLAMDYDGRTDRYRWVRPAPRDSSGAARRTRTRQRGCAPPGRPAR